MLKNLTDQSLHEETLKLVETERYTTIEILKHLREIERRRLFCRYGYGNILDYCVKELKYSESAAYRRIQAMRLLKDIPQVEEKIESGEVNLSTLAKTQTFIKQIEKTEDRKVSFEEKHDLVQQIESKSQKEVESLFAHMKPDLAVSQKDKPISSTRVLLSFTISIESRSKLQRLEELSGKPHDLEELFNLMLNCTLEKYEKFRGLRDSKKSLVDDSGDSKSTAFSSAHNSNTYTETKETITQSRTAAVLNELDHPCKTTITFTKNAPASVKKIPATLTSQPSIARKYISVHTKRAIWQRAKAQCEFRTENNHRCTQKRFLHIDHVHPKSRGGCDSLENLQLLCASHNLAKGAAMAI